MVLCGFLSHSAIIHTDITPDISSTLSINPGFGFNIQGIDFDGDGNEEYNFRWDDWGTEWFMHMTFGMGNNEFILKGVATNPFGGRYIDPLDNGIMIDGTGNWGNSFPEPFIGDNSDPNFQDLGDKYVGVRFQLNGNTHYGWVLVSFDATKTITIKEYAYEDQPDQGIISGDTGNGGNTANLVPEIINAPNIMQVGNDLIIETEIENFKIEVYSISGKQLLSVRNKKHVTLNDEDQGIYFVIFSSAETQISKKVFLD